MAEEIVIGKLVIDTNDLEASMATSKKAIIDLENEQKKLKKDTDNLSAANEQQLQTFVANETELKKLKAEYAANQKSVLDLTKAQTGLDDAIAASIKTQNEAIDNTKALTAARRQIDATTTEGAKAIADINDKIDANNEFLRANGSAAEKAATITGDYRQKIFGAGEALGGLTGKLAGFIDTAEESGGAGEAARQGLEGMARGFISATKAALKFILTPVGAILAGLAIVFVSIKTAMERSEAAGAKVQKIFSALTGVFNVLLRAVTKLGSYWIDEYVKILDKVAAASEKAAGLIADSLEFLGFEEGAKNVRSFTKEVNASVKAAQSLASAEKELTKSQREARLIQLNYQKEAEKFRQIRDDESKSIKERILANDQLGATLKAQLRDELRIAQLALKVANMRIDQEGKTSDNLDKQAEALTEIADIQERLTGQESEQLVNRNSLQKEAAANAKEATDKANAESQKRIDILKAEMAQRSLSADQQLALAQKVFDAENTLAKKSLAGNDLTKKLIENRQELSSSVLAITETQIAKEVEAQKKAFSEKAAVDQEEFASQIESANLLAKAQILLLDKSLLTEKDYAEEVVKINTAKNESLSIANDAFVEAEKVRKEAELVNTRALEGIAHQLRLQDISERAASENEIRQAILEETYANELTLLQQNLADQKISYELFTAQKTLADKKYAADTKSIDKAVADTKRKAQIGIVSDAIGAAQAIFGESKALAVASALMNTYQGITAELSTKAVTPYEIGLKVANVALVAASGFAAVKNILSTSKGSSGSGADSGAKQTTTGAGAFVNTSQTETIARVGNAPETQTPIVTPPVLILESLLEAQNNLHVKLTSG